MKDEIKEILSLLKSSSWCNEANQIEDYINNLQEENELELDENLKLSEWLVKKQKRIKELEKELQQEKKDFKEANDYCFELKDYKSRIEKAIEYIENVKILNEEDRHTTMRWEYDVLFPELENILQGSDKDDNRQNK